MDDSVQIPLKRCTKCNNDYPATTDHFHANPQKKDGLHPLCKECRQVSRRKTPKVVYEPVPPYHKRCGKCKEVKLATLEYFYSNKGAEDRLTGTCKECLQNKYRQEHPLKIDDIQEGYKRCSKCDEIKPATLEYFHRSNHNKIGLYAACRKCVLSHASIYNAKYRSEHVEDLKARKHIYNSANRDKYNLWNRQYETRHKERLNAIRKQKRIDNISAYREQARVRTHTRRVRVRGIGGSHTVQDIRMLYQRQRGRCYYCRNKVKWGEHHIEHTFPVSRVAGTDIPANDISYIVISCATCNKKKGGRFPWEFPEGGRLL